MGGSISRFVDRQYYWLPKVNESWDNLIKAPEYIRNDKEIVMIAVQQNSKALEYATPNLQNDKEVVITAIKNDKGDRSGYASGHTLKFASPELKNDIEVVMAAVKKHGGKALRYASPKLQGDKHVVLAALSNDDTCFALTFASPELRNDKDVAMTAIRHDFSAIRYVAPALLLQDDQDITQLRNDKAAVMKAIQKDTWQGRRALKYATHEVRSDKDVVMAAIQQSIIAFKYASLELQSNKEFVLTAIRLQKKTGGTKNSSFCVLEHISPALQSDKAVVMAAVEINGLALKFATPELIQNNEDIVMVAVQENGRALQYASPKFCSSKRVVMAAVKTSGEALQHVSPELQNDKEVVMTAIQRSYGGSALKYASPQLQNDKEIVMILAAQEEGGCDAFQFASSELRNDKEFVLIFLKSNPDSIKYVHEDLKRDPDVLVAAGMFDDDGHHDDDAIARRMMATTTDVKKKIVLSTRFSLDPTSKSEATNFTKLLKEHPYIRNGNFKIYAPNAFDKKTCDPDWTNFDWPCRGTTDNCQYNNVLTEDGHPTDGCCWRYSFRHQVEEAKATGGFMLQLVEGIEEDFGTMYQPQTLGKGQKIERHMAQEINLKTFHAYRPICHRRGGYQCRFNKYHIGQVVKAIEAWYDAGGKDTSLKVVIAFEESGGCEKNEFNVTQQGTAMKLQKKFGYKQPKSKSIV